MFLAYDMKISWNWEPNFPIFKFVVLILKIFWIFMHFGLMWFLIPNLSSFFSQVSVHMWEKKKKKTNKKQKTKLSLFTFSTKHPKKPKISFVFLFLPLKTQRNPKIKTLAPSPFPSIYQLRNIRNSEISRLINLLSSHSFSSSSWSSKIGFLGWYLGMLETHPLITKNITFSLIFAVADLTS